MLKSQYIRETLILALRGFSDPEYQRRVWLDPTKFESFDEAIHVLYDDTPLAIAIDHAIGYILYDQREAEAVTQVIKAVDRVLDTLGKNASDEEYMRCPEWQEIVPVAAVALAILNEREPTGLAALLRRANRKWGWLRTHIRYRLWLRFRRKRR